MYSKNYCFSLLLFLALNQAALASDSAPTQHNDSASHFVSAVGNSPYCGLVSVCTCINAIGKHVPYDDLVATRYATGSSGSKLSDLQQLALDCGAPSYTGSGLLPEDLDNLAYPAVLHVRASISDKEFSHWIAFLGMNGDSYRLFDINKGFVDEGAGYLSAVWDGRLLVIGASEPPRLPPSCMRRTRMLLLLGFLVCLLWRDLCMQNKKIPNLHRGLSVSRALRQFLLLGSVALVGGVIYQSLSRNGIISNSTLLAPLQRRHANVSVRLVDTEEMNRIVLSQRSVIIDSRRAEDYARGTIPGAISIPIDSTLTKRRATLKSIDHKESIVVFCQSEACRFSDEIADFLVINGYEHVSIYRDGYVEWKRFAK